jgi:AcrR family transcriptional regulator
VRLVKAARALVLRSGPAGLTLRAVASRAGVSLSNLQFHFPGAEALWRALLDAEMERAAARVEKQMAARPADPAAVAIDAMLGFQTERGAARLFFSLWAVATTAPPLRAALRSFYAEWIKRVARLASTDDEERAWVFVALLEGASLFRCGVAGRANRAQEAALRQALRRLLGV